MQNQSNDNPYHNLSSKANLQFDYETYDLKVEDKNENSSKIYYMDKKTNSYSIYYINKDKFKYDMIDDLDIFEENKDSHSNLYKACLLKRLVSKKKKRYQTQDFDLDLA